MRHRLLTLGPDNEPLWVRRSVHLVGEKWGPPTQRTEEPRRWRAALRPMGPV